jgi:hypothetical protein
MLYKITGDQTGIKQSRYCIWSFKREIEKTEQTEETIFILSCVYKRLFPFEFLFGFVRFSTIIMR